MVNSLSKIKLWITDIDGTIMNYDSSYTPEMAELIALVQTLGIKFVLATGRMFQGAKFVADKFNLSTPVVCYQGAVVRDKDKVLWQAPVETSIAYEIISYLKEKNIHTHVYNDDILYIDDNNKKIMDTYCNNRGTDYSVIENLLDLKLTTVPKILAVIEDSSLMQKVEKELSEKYKGVLTIVKSTSIYLEITDINASKGNALNFLKKYFNILDNEVAASGDQDNDIDMLQNAYYKIAVGSNSEKLNKIANYHCKDVNSNDLVKVIKGLIKID